MGKFQLQILIKLNTQCVWLCSVNDGVIEEFDDEASAQDASRMLGDGLETRVVDILRCRDVSEVCRESRGGPGKPAPFCDEGCFVCSAVLAETMTRHVLFREALKKYDKWIAENVQNPQHACQSVTEKMTRLFPELTKVRGFVSYPGMSSRAATNHPFDAIGIMHWWCKTSYGRIVDPTKAQFESNQLSYEEYDEDKHGPMPTGKCMNCGDLCYEGRVAACSDECERALA